MLPPPPPSVTLLIKQTHTGGGAIRYFVTPAIPLSALATSFRHAARSAILLWMWFLVERGCVVKRSNVREPSGPSRPRLIQDFFFFVAWDAAKKTFSAPRSPMHESRASLVQLYNTTLFWDTPEREHASKPRSNPSTG